MEALMLALVGIGGAAGSMLRYGLSKIRPLRGIPMGTMLVNVLGSCAISILAFANVSGPAYALLCTGVLGGFTTFSTFGFETFRMLEDRDYRTAALNIFLNVAGSLAGVYIGYKLMIR